jgi:hypothetical protein
LLSATQFTGLVVDIIDTTYEIFEDRRRFQLTFQAIAKIKQELNIKRFEGNSEEGPL